MSGLTGLRAVMIFQKAPESSHESAQEKNYSCQGIILHFKSKIIDV